MIDLKNHLEIPEKMQCIRGNDHSPPVSPMRSSISMDSLNKYLSRRIHRKSLVRRSFEIVRKNFVRHSQYLLPQNRTKVREIVKKSGSSQNERNNHRPSYDDNFQTTDQHFSNTYCGDGDIFVISTDSDILTSNTNNRKQFRSNVR